MHRQTLLLIATVCLGAACAGVQVAPERIAKTEGSIRGAEEVGAANVPKARLHLQYAKDQTEFAKKLSEKGDERADTVLSMAEADAELALELAREEAYRAEAQRATDEVKMLQGRSN